MLASKRGTARPLGIDQRHTLPVTLRLDEISLAHQHHCERHNGHHYRRHDRNMPWITKHMPEQTEPRPRGY